MNNRIKELAEQALKSSMVHDGVYRPEGYDNSVSKIFADTFAELLIRECARAVDRVYETAPPDHGCYDWATFPDGDDVLKHFGIEK